MRLKPILDKFFAQRPPFPENRRPRSCSKSYHVDDRLPRSVELFLRELLFHLQDPVWRSTAANVSLNCSPAAFSSLQAPLNSVPL